jgi:hypothetical protein
VPRIRRRPAPVRARADDSTDQIVRAIPRARLDTNPRASRTPDNESARRSHTQYRAFPAESRQAALPALATRRPAVARYAGTLPSAPAAPHRASAAQRYPAILPAAPLPPARETSRPAAGQTETLGRCGRAAKQTSPRDGTVRNGHRKKDIPRQARSTAPEKHSTSPRHACARSARRSTPCRTQREFLRRSDRSCGNAAPFALASVSENL